VQGRSVLALELHRKLYYTNRARKPLLLCWQKCKVHLLVDWFFFFFFLLFLGHLWAQRRVLRDTAHVQRREERAKGGVPLLGHPSAHPDLARAPTRGWRSLSYSLGQGCLQGTYGWRWR